MKRIFKLAAYSAVLVSIFACNKISEPQMNEESASLPPITKAIGDKSPVMAVYVETNDVNPLNALDYHFSGDTERFIDILELFAANIHKETVNGQVRPTLYLNDKLTNVLENGGVGTYVNPLQDWGISVLLTILGDHQGIGLANMTDTQADQFATILVAVVKHYGLDGLGFDDEYADYPWVGNGVNNTSYSRILTKVHELYAKYNIPNKLITVFDWGFTNRISATAASYIDFAYHGYFGNYRTDSNIAGINKPRWSPVSFNLGGSISLTDAQNFAANAKNNGYGAMMCFNLRTRNDKDALPVFQAFSNGAYGGRTVACVENGGNRSRDAVIVPTGFTITYDTALTWLAE